MGQEEDDEEEEIGAADKDEQMCSAACLGRLSPARALALVDLQVHGLQLPSISNVCSMKLYIKLYRSVVPPFSSITIG